MEMRGVDEVQGAGGPLEPGRPWGQQEGSATPAVHPRPREERWRSEAAFFDRMAEAGLQDVRPMPDAVVARYTRRAPRRRYEKEYRFGLLGDLRGRRVLDLGCGEGSNSVLLAKRGAHVTGVDISPRSVELAEARARASGVDDRTEFVCSPLEVAGLRRGAFDVVWGDGILHHVIPELDAVLTRVRSWARPGGRFIFYEPVCHYALLRRLRRFIPIHTNATPDERPLMQAELATLRRHLPGLEMRYFGLFGRFSRLWLAHGYEAAPPARRVFTDAVFGLDWVLLGLKRLETIGGMAVITGTF